MGGAQSTHAKGTGAGANKTGTATRGGTSAGARNRFRDTTDRDLETVPALIAIGVPMAIGAISGLIEYLQSASPGPAGAIPSSFPITISDELELIKLRHDAYHRKSREGILSKLKSIEDTAKERSLHDPLHQSRPYGLAEDMQGLRRHIWDLIFVQVNDLESIANLRKACTMFRNTLERKYVAALLPKIIVHCLERKVIPWRYGGSDEISNWAKTMTSLRNLSKATKESIDNIFDRGMLKERDWFNLGFPYLVEIEYWKIPHLILGASDAEQARLQRTLDSLELHGSPRNYSLVRAIMFNECRDDNLPFDRQNLRDAFQKCLEIIGPNITSFRYWTRNESPLNVYINLRRFVALMPNLEELMVTFTRPGESPYFEKVNPFPTCPNLKRYVEGPDGFGYPYINEIFKANQTIEEVLIGNAPASSWEVENLKEVLDGVQLTTFNCTCMPTMEFLKHRFSWAQQLTILTLWDTTATSSPKIPSDAIFSFLSSFKNLKILGFMSSRIYDTGGYLNLPMLEEVYWQIVPGFRSMEFLKPVENLKVLLLDVSSLSRLEFTPTCKVMEFLKQWHIPALFPGLEEIRMSAERNAAYKTIWKLSA